jgi:hypothetical protein
MLRTIGGVIAGVVAWLVCAEIFDLTLRAVWPAYLAAWPTMAFTLPMMIARLAESTVALVIAAWVAGAIANSARAVFWALGVVMLVLFIPDHVHVWTKFPIWYHAYFLSSLLLIPLAVGMLMRRETP